MGFTSIWHWIIVLAIVVILFARPGKISGIMGDFGKGLRNFRQGVKGGEEEAGADEAELIEAEEVEEAPAAAPKKRPLKKPLLRKQPQRRLLPKKQPPKKRLLRKKLQKRPNLLKALF